MKILVIGSGGREHTLVWKLAQSKKVQKIYTAPGNAGTALHGDNVDIKVDEIDTLIEFAQAEKIDLTVVGPEAPLMLGIVDRFEAEGLPVFGPTRKAAQLEGSKIFAKQLMAANDIPTADFTICSSRAETEAAVADKVFPYVIKVDGLAAGKGALIIKNETDLKNALDEIWTQKKFGNAGERILIEDFLTGEELSIFAITDGERYVLMAPAQDHKRAFDDDKGPNTGGMGAYAPAPLGSPEVLKEVEKQVIQPTLAAMRTEGCPYRGVLYCGLMIDHGQPSVVEFNARFGDPEAQVTIPLIGSDLVDVLLQVAQGNLNPATFQLRDEVAACVIMASGGYPGSYTKGKPIEGIGEELESENSIVFMAGVAYRDHQFVTSGGRVLGVTRLADDLQAAIAGAYDRIAGIHFEAAHFRKDIGKKGLRRLQRE